MTPLFFLLAAFGFGFVIFIHELGHFLFAKWAGVKVEVFSIGFGPRLLTKRIGETEYSLSLLPLGGYVKMTGQEDLPEDASAPATAATARDPRSFLHATPLWKAAILLGGVLFNFLSSYAILLGLALYGLPVLRPIVGEVQTEIIGSDGQSRPSPAAEMGLRPGDRVLTINGDVVRSFEDLSTGAIIAGRKPITLTVARPGIAEPLTLPQQGTVTAAYDANAGRPVLGLQLPYSNRLAQLPEWYPAATGEAPRAGERVVAIDGIDLTAEITGQEIHERLQPDFAKPIRITLAEAGGSRRTTTVIYSGLGDGVEASLGLPPVITGISAGSAAAEAGLRPGDVITRIDGVAPSGSDHCLALVRTAMQQGNACTISVRRQDGSTLTAALSGREQAGRRRLGIMLGTLSHGIVPVLAPNPAGTPSAAATAGLNPGDALVRWETDSEDRTRFHATVARGGFQIEIPLTAEGAKRAATSSNPGTLASLFGGQARAALADELRGTQIAANTDPVGNPTGSPAPGLLLVTTPGGAPRTVDLRPLQADGEALLQQVRVGDWILGIATGADGQPCWQLLRGTEKNVREVTLNGSRLGRPLLFDVEVVPYQLGSLGEAFAIANRAAHTMIWKSLQFIPKFFQAGDDGGLDAKKSLQGPIGIFDALRVNAENYGFTSFLNLVALIGLNLVLVNLLPIPITDGGQLVFLAIETAMGRPLPPLVRTIAAYIGLGLVVALMLFVTTLDIARRL
jgi:membrane-associated protease RseP (regulator of RpoE activity)